MKILLYSFLLIVLPFGLQGEIDDISSMESGSRAIPKKTDPNVSIEYTSPTELPVGGDEAIVQPRIETYFNDRDLLSRLNLTADSLNASLDTLMESIFYHLLDQQFTQKISNGFRMVLTLDRQVFSTALGAYVIADKLQYGPEHYKRISQIQGLDILLGAKAGVSIMDIRLQTDAKRITDERDLPPYRYFINNWFGILPWLEKVLPPSFNANELYDPLQLAATPFRFPFMDTVVEAMPVGTIRSYSVSGGVSLPLNFLSWLSQGQKNFFDRLKIQNQLPYAIFIQGEHRINVLKKSEHIFWVGLSTEERLGHSISALLGNTFFLFAHSINPIPWKGVGLLLAPINYEWSDAVVHNYDSLFEFDLRDEKAKKVYYQAVKGDFREANTYKVPAQEKKSIPVRYQFEKNRRAVETETNASRNLVILRETRKKKVIKAETEIIEPRDRYYFLEGTGSVKDEGWNVLVGNRSVQYEFSVEMEVDKIRETQSFPSSNKEYQFHNPAKPYQVQLYMNIQDRAVNSHNYAAYLTALRTFSRMSLQEAPVLPLIEVSHQNAYQRSRYLDSPLEPPMHPHVVETEVGRFAATGNLILSYEQIQKILAFPAAVQWKRLAEAYGVTEENPSRFMEWMKKVSVYPIRILDTRSVWADGVLEVDELVEALARLKVAKTPLETLNGFYHLFDVDYPSLALDGLLRMVEDPVPVKVMFSIDPKTSLEENARKRLLELNKQAFVSGVPFPKLDYHRIEKEKLQAFFPKNLLAFLSLRMRGAVHQKELFLQFKARNVSPGVPLQAFLQIEEFGKDKIFHHILDHSVVLLMPVSLPMVENHGGEPLEQTYQVFLTGRASPLRNPDFVKQMAEGGGMRLRIAVSKDHQAWSEEKILAFTYENQRLLPPE